VEDEAEEEKIERRGMPMWPSPCLSNPGVFPSMGQNHCSVTLRRFKGLTPVIQSLFVWPLKISKIFFQLPRVTSPFPRACMCEQVRPGVVRPPRRPSLPRLAAADEFGALTWNLFEELKRLVPTN